EAQVRLHGGVDQQRLESMPLGQTGGVVAAQRTADQNGIAQLGDQRLQLGHGLARVMMQGGHAQLVFQAKMSHGAAQLAGFERGWRAVQAVYIEDGYSHGAGGYSSGASSCKLQADWGYVSNP